MYTGTYYQLMATYNQWMNQRLYAVCAQIPDTVRKQEMGAFFKSIHGTLNHLLWADQVWLSRFTDRPSPRTPLGQNVCDRFDTLRQKRDELDRFIVDWADQLDPNWLLQPFEYTSMVDGVTRRIPTWVLVTHLFNHQTHHRGQVTTLVKQLGFDPGVTDIPWSSGVASIKLAS